MWAAHPAGQHWDHQKLSGPFSSPLQPTCTQIWHIGSINNSSYKSRTQLQIVFRTSKKTQLLLQSSSHSSWLKSEESQDGASHCHSQLTSCFSSPRAPGGGKTLVITMVTLQLNRLIHSTGTCFSLNALAHENMNTLFKMNSRVEWHLEIWELSQICFQVVDGGVHQFLMEVLPQNVTVLQTRRDSHQPD